MMPVEFDISGKVVFITGAGRGIGLGFAQVLAVASADVALNAPTPKYVEDTTAKNVIAPGIFLDVVTSGEERVR
jgi:NAD(P)-dependent dehydrogenase (short-subunit alcohol dehydrogenase family)